MVRDITYYFIKFYYDKQLKDNNKNKLDETYLREMIDKLYIDKASELKKYIRDTLKDNLKSQYNSLVVENIILEMFNDPEYSKHRVYLEIIEFQKTVS